MESDASIGLSAEPVSRLSASTSQKKVNVRIVEFICKIAERFTKRQTHFHLSAEFEDAPAKFIVIGLP